MTDSSRPYGIAPPGFRLPQATRVGAVRLQVANLSRSVDYYSDVLGLRVPAVIRIPVLLAPEGDTRPLVELHALAGGDAAPRQGRLGLFHFAILLPDRAALGRFIRHSSSRARAGMADHSVREAVYLTDPDGLGIEVYADRPRQSWRTSGASSS